ncbi:cysteine-rich CWC family protein [uncultured Caballeronia sp.]|uniref:cysteine-rich CWC family protein n=1 Tax=uncultured Caballeronia sp. TaxID=1827198 RepID=UPI0035CC95A7
MKPGCSRELPNRFHSILLDTMTDTRSGSSALQHCARCGVDFRCGSQSGDATCWCASMPVLPADRLEPRLTCLCPACLSEKIGRIVQK